MNDFNGLLGKRVLVQMKHTGYTYGMRQQIEVREVLVLEVSPSGTWVKLQDQFGSKWWAKPADVPVAETLADVARRPKATEAAP